LSGTVAAQMLPILFAPVLTRMYTPEHFGVLGIYIATTSIFGVIASLRFELAIVQCSTKGDALKLTNLSILISVFISLFLLLLIYVFEDTIQQLFKGEIDGWVFLIPLSVLSIGVFQSLLYLNNRQAKFSLIAKSKIVQSLVNILFCLGFYFIDSNPTGLILGHILGQITLAIMLARSWGFGTILKINRFSLNRYYFLLKKNKRFPLISAPGALLDTASLQAPVLFINQYYSVLLAGFYNFIYRIMGAPFALTSSAIAQVFLQKVATERGVALSQIKSILKVSLIPSILFVAVINLFGEQLFYVIFGKSWAEAGVYAGIIVFSIVIRFTVSPLSMVMALKRNLKLGFCWQLSYFISILLVIYFMVEKPFKDFLYVFVTVDVVLYLVYFALIIFAAKRV
jgi:O-antigen/teichoic acid export membrane protein